MNGDDILESLKSKGVIWIKHVLDGYPQRGRLLGGIVTDISETTKTINGTDHRTILTLLEPSTTKSEAKIILFHSEHKKPTNLKKGDIFLCLDARTNIRFRNFNAVRMTPWATYDVDTLKSTCEGDTNLICNDTMIIILGLYQTWSKKATPLAPPPARSTSTSKKGGRPSTRMGTGRRMIVSTEDMKPKTFIDYVGMVVNSDKVEQSDDPITNLRLTDYTMNLKPIGLPYNERNKLTLPIDILVNCTLFDENSKDCPPNLCFGDYVYIKNANCKLDQNGAMEMVVRHDAYKTTEKIWRLDDNDPLISEIKRLRLAYEDKCKRDREESGPPPSPLIPSSPKKRKTFKIRTVGTTVPQEYSFIKDVMLDNYETEHNLRVSIIDYKPKTIANMSVKFCEACSETSTIDATQCKKCDNHVDKIVYRCLLQFKDAHGDILMAVIYGTTEEPIFRNIPVVNLKENKDVCDQVAQYMDALCPPDQEKGPLLNMRVKAYVYDNCLRCVIQDTKYRLDLE